MDLSRERIDTLASSSGGSRLSIGSSSSSSGGGGGSVVSERRKVKASSNASDSASSSTNASCNVSASGSDVSASLSGSSASSSTSVLGSVGLYADDEAMAMAAFNLFTLTYRAWTPPPPFTPSLDLSPRALSTGPFAGPFLAHTAQLALSFAMHRSKHVAIAALRFLHTALARSVIDDAGSNGGRGDMGIGNRDACRGNANGDSTNANANDDDSNNSLVDGRQEQWRTYLPGLFSGLFAVCALPRIHRGAAVQGLGTPSLRTLLFLLLSFLFSSSSSFSL